ncbi:type III secretion system outer membrane ring subunit SctC [Piscinibacter terrae]|uniref:Type 3 secretion system secretin n=1 Tax=Piscinibacter terrae TaxID=2496871 RepID=A0A3N7HK19_9BURK|nr:type III secretion system outer membrane ring subunit SctC [Albitalea terrae]RQP21316.1 EscC/YscC/HrcC family type III secretion system outer membrane ring protein [Albitalea terrae]
MIAPHRFARIALIVALACFAAHANAGEPRWKDEMFVYAAKGKNLKEFLREFGASQGLMVVVAKEVDGTVNGKFNLLPGSLMELLSASFGFIWHAEGNVVYVTPASDVRSDVVHMSNTGVGRLRQALEQLNIPDRRFPILYDARQNSAIVSGPSRYVELVMQTAKAVDQNLNIGTGSEVRVFPLRYAWAADTSFKHGNREERIPGVATVLSQLYGNDTGVQLPAARPARAGTPADALRALGLVGTATSAVGKGRLALDAPPPEAAAPRGSEGGLPQFRADGRMNAVIVRDVPERMRAHEAAIKALDVKAGLVEIEVRIIEVNVDAAESLGINWRFRDQRNDYQVGSGNLPTLSWGTALADGAPQVGPNGNNTGASPAAGVLTTVLGDAGKFLIARVSALAQDGRANMLSSPKLLTLDNVEAVIENLDTFFVRVAGNLEVNLFDVSVGTSLRVTPLIVSESGERQQVKLAVRIEDGALTGQTVDQVPVVRRSAITTQSFIADGQSLLIAGYTQESDSAGQTGVPGLSSIPVAGWLFKSSSKTRKRVERLYLLTPKVVAPS